MSGILGLVGGGGAASSVTVRISPLSVFASGSGLTHTFRSCTVTVTGGTPSSYLWTCENQLVGLWYVNSGGTTDTATARVASVLGQETGTCDFQCAVVVAGATYVATAGLYWYNTDVAP